MAVVLTRRDAQLKPAGSARRIEPGRAIWTQQRSDTGDAQVCITLGGSARRGGMRVTPLTSTAVIMQSPHVQRYLFKFSTYI